MTTTTVVPALVTVNGLMYARHTDPASVAELAHDLRYRPSSLSANLVVRLADPRIESPGESRTAYFLWSQHLPRPIPQASAGVTSCLIEGRRSFTR